MFCLQIHALAGSTMNAKFSILHSATPHAVLKISRPLCGQRVRVFVNKTLTTVSNPYILTLIVSTDLTAFSLFLRPISRFSYSFCSVNKFQLWYI